MEALTQDLYNENIQLKSLIQEQQQQINDLDQLQLLSSGLEKQNDFLKSQIPLQNAEIILQHEQDLKILKQQLQALQASHTTLDTKFQQISKSDQIAAKNLQQENSLLKDELSQLQLFIQRNENYTGNLIQKYTEIQQKTKLTEQFLLANQFLDKSYDNCLRNYTEYFKFLKETFRYFPIVNDVKTQFQVIQLKTVQNTEFLAKFGVPYEIAINYSSFEKEIIQHFINNWNDIFESHLVQFLDGVLTEIQEIQEEERVIDKKMFEVDEREWRMGKVVNFIIASLVLQGFSLEMDGNGMYFKKDAGVWYIDV